MKACFVLTLAAGLLFVAPATAQIQTGGIIGGPAADRLRPQIRGTIIINPQHRRARPPVRHSRPPLHVRPVAVYKPQPFVPPKEVRVGSPNCGEEGKFDQDLGRCVAAKITHIDMPAAHKAYLANCPGIIETRTSYRDGVLVEQQRCKR
ncbi:MAG: hypothetical protein AAB449_00770 [Patescibacteria group bacterium]